MLRVEVFYKVAPKMALPHSMAGPHDKSAHPDRTYCSKQNEEAAITQLLRMQPDQIRFYLTPRE